MPIENESSHQKDCAFEYTQGIWVCVPWCIFSPQYRPLTPVQPYDDEENA